VVRIWEVLWLHLKKTGKYQITRFANQYFLNSSNKVPVIIYFLNINTLN